VIYWHPKFLRHVKFIIKVFHNTSWRFGRPYKCHNYNPDRVSHLFRPGMVLLTRKEHQLSNYFIPGYWTHSAMILPHGQIIEATGKGVGVKTICDFFRSIDDFMLLRPRFCNEERMLHASHHASSLIGYPYSFDFKGSGNAYYCAQLVITAYARSCGWNREETFPPAGFRQFQEGKIIRPIDFANDPSSWEIVSRGN